MDTGNANKRREKTSMRMSNTHDIIFVNNENANPTVSRCGVYENYINVILNIIFIIFFFIVSMIYYYYSEVDWSLMDCFYFVTVCTF